MVSIDGTDISGVTIDGTDVQEITIDGTTAWESFTPALPNTEMYVAGEDNDAYYYNDGWSTFPNTGTSFDEHVVPAMATDTTGTPYVIGGYDNDGNDSDLVSYWEGSSWQNESLTTRKYNPAATADPYGRIYAIGGRNNYNDPDTTGVVYYKDEGGDWMYDGALRTEREGAAAVYHNDCPTVIGGVDKDFNYVRGVERYASQSWNFVSGMDLPDDFNEHGASKGPNGNIIITGGNGFDGRKVAYEWDGSSWNRLPDMNKRRFRHGQTQAANGNAVVIGGYSSDHGGVRQSCEMWDGSSWTFIEDLPAPMQRMAATSPHEV